jgi:hypothetical protein
VLTDEQKWPLVHDYRRMSAAGKVPPILCPDCNGELVPTAHAKDEDPHFRCLACRTVFSISLWTYEQMLANLEEL